MVDGYYVGIVDDFDGTFQSLKLEPGPANIEVRAPGFEALRLDVRVLPGHKITYEENMRAGDPGQAPPPTAARRAPAQGPDPGGAEGRPVPRDRDAEPEPPAGFAGQPPAFGGVRLRIEPRSAQVFVDGYESLQIKVWILPDETITCEGDLMAAPGQ